MADSFGKKDREKKRKKKREEKAERKVARQAEENTGSDIMYIHPDGQLRDTPPDPADNIEVDASAIVLGAQNNVEEDIDPIRNGKVSFFNHDKGFGFINDSANGESVFVHLEGLIDEINDSDKVVFEVRNGPKGLIAFNVRLKKNVPDPIPEEKPKAETEEGTEGKDETTEESKEAESEKPKEESAESTEESSEEKSKEE